MHRRSRWMILILCSGMLLLPSCRRTSPTNEEKDKTRIELEILYKKNQLCYAIANSEEDTSLYSFNPAGQPIFDQDGQAVTAWALSPGMVVSLEYDGYILETFPCQFSDVSEVRITGSESNNVDFLASQISEMLPSSKDAAHTHWAVSFDGEAFLNSREKRALKMILEDRFEGATVTVEADKEEGTISLLAADTDNTVTVSVPRLDEEENPVLDEDENPVTDIISVRTITFLPDNAVVVDASRLEGADISLQGYTVAVQNGSAIHAGKNLTALAGKEMKSIDGGISEVTAKAEGEDEAPNTVIQQNSVIVVSGRNWSNFQPVPISYGGSVEPEEPVEP